MTEEEWIRWVRGTIRAIMVKRRITYADLVERLKGVGVEENERNLRNKVARGTFSAVFFVQCLEALGLETLLLDMRSVMAQPEGEREFQRQLPQAPTTRQIAELDKILTSVRAIIGENQPASGKDSLQNDDPT